MRRQGGGAQPRLLAILRGEELMISGVYRIAGWNEGITTIYEEFHDRSREYRHDGPAAFWVEMTREDIDRMRAGFAASGVQIAYPDSFYEHCMVRTRLAELLLPHGVLLFHGAAVAVDGAAYIFTAKSGTGKSTHAQYWRALFGERAVIINDDKPFLHMGADGVTVYGSPWAGKDHIQTNASAPVRAVCLLERSESNFITAISPGEAFPILYRETCLLDTAEHRRRQLALLDKLSRSVRLYRLGVNMTVDAARVAYEGMNGGAGT